MAGRALEIQQRAVGDRDLTRGSVDGETPAGIVCQGVGGAVASVRIGRRDRADRGPIGGVLVHRVAGQGQVRGSLVDVPHVDREGLGVGVAAAIGDPDRDVVGSRALEVQEAAVRHGDLARGAVDGEAPAGVVGQREAGAVAGVRIGGRHRADRGAVGGVLVHRVAGQVQVGRRLVLVADADREGLAIGQAAAVRHQDRHVVAGGALAVQQRAVRDRDGARGGVNREAAAGIVRQGVAGRVAGVRIRRRDIADDRAVGGVLGDKAGGEVEIGRRLVHVADRDREGLAVGQAAAVGDLNRHVVTGGALEVEQAAVGHGDLAGRAVDGEPAAGVVGQRVGRAVAGVGIGRRDRADRGPVGGVLVHRIGRQFQIRRLFVDVTDVDGEGLRVGVAAAVGDPNGDVVAGRALEVQQAAVGDRDLAGRAVDSETPAGVVGEDIAGAVPGIRIGRGDRADAGPIGGILINAVRRKCQICRRFVDVVDVDCEGFAIGQTAAVGDQDRHVVAGRGLEVEQAAVGDRDLAGGGVDGEAAAGVVRQAVGRAVACVRVGRRDRTDRGADCGVLGHIVAGEIQVRRPLVDVADVDREGLAVGQAAAVSDPDRHVVAGGVLEVEQRAVRDGDLAGGAVDGETATGVVRQCKACRIGRIRIRCRDSAHRRPVGGILVDGVAGQRQVHRRLVLVRDGDREDLGVGQPAGIGDPDRDVVTARGLEVEQSAVRHGDLTRGGVDGEAPAGVVCQAIGGAVAGIGVGRRDRAHAGSISGVLGHRIAGQVEIRRRLVDVADVDREGFAVGQAAAVGDLHRHVVAGRALEVQQAAVRHRDLTGGGIDGEAPAGVVG